MMVVEEVGEGWADLGLEVAHTKLGAPPLGVGVGEVLHNWAGHNHIHRK